MYMYVYIYITIKNDTASLKCMILKYTTHLACAQLRKICEGIISYRIFLILEIDVEY